MAGISLPRGARTRAQCHLVFPIRTSAHLVLHHCQFFAARDDFGGARVRRTKENSPARQRWEGVKDTGSPGTGRKSFYSGASFAPFRGWSIGYGNPRLTPWAMLFRPPGLVLWLRLCRSAGQPILAAAGFQPTLAGCEGSLSARRSRLKAAAGKIARPTICAAEPLVRAPLQRTYRPNMGWYFPGSWARCISRFTKTCRVWPVASRRPSSATRIS